MMNKNNTRKKICGGFFLSGKSLHWVLCLFLCFQSGVIQAEETPNILGQREKTSIFSAANGDITIIGDVRIINENATPQETIKIYIAEGAQLIDAHQKVRNYTLVTVKSQNTRKGILAKTKLLTKEKAVEPTISEKKHNVNIGTLKPAPATTGLYALGSGCHHSFVPPTHDYKKVAQNVAIFIMQFCEVLPQKGNFFMPGSKTLTTVFYFTTRGPPQLS